MPQSSTPKKKSCHKEQTSGSLLDPDNGFSHLSTSELSEANLVRHHINEQLTILFVDLKRPKTVIIAVFDGQTSRCMFCFVQQSKMSSLESPLNNNTNNNSNKGYISISLHKHFCFTVHF